MANVGDLKYNVFLVSLVDKWTLLYRAFCAGNIISTERILTSAHCFLTNRKRYLREKDDVKVVAGLLMTTIQQPVEHPHQQWRKITKVFSQSYFRFPAFSLAVVEVDQPFTFNSFVHSIPFASKNSEFDGICISSTVRPISVIKKLFHTLKIIRHYLSLRVPSSTALTITFHQSWTTSSSLCLEKSRMIPREQCEMWLLRSCRLYYCTAYNKESAAVSFEAEGGGLVCYHTGDPAEENNSGVLVGVAVLINVHLPSLHHRIAPFRKWVIDGSSAPVPSNLLIALLVFLLIVK